MSERSSLSPYHRELLLSLAYLGGLTYALTLRLLPCYSARTLQRDLSDLRELGDVEKHAIYKPGPKGRPVKLYDVWTLTDKGHGYISEKANDQYPTKPAKLRHKRVMRHDLLVVETVVTMVELARKDGLSGLYVQCEMRLNPTERRPIPDAVVIVQFGGGFTQADIVPWTKDPAIKDETRSRFLIEADNQTETLSVIAGKAVAYRAAYYDPQWRAWWAEQFGPLPLICWVIADKDEDPEPAIERLHAISRVWDAEWPDIYWAGTTEHMMKEQSWFIHAATGSSWYYLHSLQTERKGISEARRPALPADRAQSLSSSDAAAVIPVPASPTSGANVHHTSPSTGERTYINGASVDVSPPTSRVAASAKRPIHAEASTLYTTSSSYGAVVPSTASTAMERRVGAWSSADTRTHNDQHTRYDAIPLVSPPQRPIYVPPSVLDILIEWCGRFVYGLQEVYYEISYLSVRFLTLLGIFWTIRTSVRLFRWLFWEDGYIFVGAFLVFIVMLGFLGWVGQSVYREYQKEPFFTFSKPAPTPGELDVVPLVVPSPHVMDSIPAPSSPTAEQSLSTTCGSAFVISDALNVRATPGGAIQGKLFRGQEVILLCDQEQVGTTIWVRVQAKQREGWVSKHFIR